MLHTFVTGLSLPIDYEVYATLRHEVKDNSPMIRRHTGS